MPSGATASSSSPRRASRLGSPGLANAAVARGVDRVVRLGSMHVFDSPWDGMELVRPLTRRVRYTPSHHDDPEERHDG